ncbi:MAG: flagellar hook-associated protein FlgL [Thermoguttaceae bacterium]
MGILGISTTGISNLSMQDLLIGELNANQTQMNQLETEISTGYQFQLPSQNPQAAMQVEGIQSLLERKTQMLTNISTSQSSLSQTDSTLTTVSNLLTSVQSAALSVVGATATAAQRQAVVQQIDSAVQQLVSLGNTQFNGQQLFGGTNTTTPPFSIDGAGNVVYSGTSNPTESYVDVNQLSATSITGAQAFGAMSQPIEGTTLTPALSLDTPLSELNGGRGVALGSIAISDGQGNTSIVNLSGAQTLGDVAAMIEQNPPTGRTVDVNVTPTGLTLQLEPDAAYPSGDDLSVQEVNGNTTASDLGILNASGVGAGPLVGQTLTAAITPTTSLSTLFGAQAQANIHFGEPNSDIIIQANTPGTARNGVTVHFVNDAPSAGQESATYAGGTLTVHISTSTTSASRASQIVTAINNVPGLPFTASLDPSDQNGGGQPPITTLPADIITAGGSGTTLDPAGLQLTSEGKTYTVDVSGDKTVQDLLNGINKSGADLDAEINATQTAINVSSRVSGTNFSIGENGGTTAAQLGIRTFTLATQLSQMNLGAGVGVNTAAPGGTDFTISETVDNPPGTTIQVPVSIAGDLTVGDVITSINNAAQAAGATFAARLVPSGNSIELTDNSNGPIVVTASSQSTAAVDLGLVPKSQTSATSTATATIATGAEASGPNSELFFQAVNPGSVGDVQVVFQPNAAITAGNETVQYDPVAKTLTFQIASAQPPTTANDIIAALKNNPTASAAFTATLDTAGDPGNDGSGAVSPQSIEMTGGGTVLTGSDSNPQQTDSVFNALIRLGTALQNNDQAAIQQSMTLLSNSMQNLGNARDQLGVQEQSLSSLTTQINNEQINLQSAMSTDYDTDMASAVSEYTGAQIAYQATLETTASLLKLTLLNYL